MGDPHRKDRYGETWPQNRIDAYLDVLKRLRPYVVLSGGWAWHFMSEPGHPEYKHAHDHKDCDLMTPKVNVPTVMGLLLSMGFQRVATKYDRLPSEEDFRRYEKVVDDFRLTIDFFVRDVPFTVVNGWQVVDPATLVTFYGSHSKAIHSSSECFAVQAARRLLAQGISPIGHPDLSKIPTE
jgi:hypothetical protein